MTVSMVGALVGVEDVKQAIISLLSTPPKGGTSPLLVYYLAEIERQNGLEPRTLPPPPDTDSIYGGVDFLSWEQVLLPTLIVATQPTGAPERYGDGTYGGWFESQVCAIVHGDSETQAQSFAAYYGSAVTGLLLENGDLGGIADKTTLTEAARLELVEEPATRLFAQSIVTVQSFLEPIASDLAGPTTWPSDPYTEPFAAPTVTATDFRLTAEPLD